MLFPDVMVVGDTVAVLPLIVMVLRLELGSTELGILLLVDVRVVLDHTVMVEPLAEGLEITCAEGLEMIEPLAECVEMAELFAECVEMIEPLAEGLEVAEPLVECVQITEPLAEGLEMTEPLAECESLADGLEKIVPLADCVGCVEMTVPFTEDVKIIVSTGLTSLLAGASIVEGLCAEPLEDAECVVLTEPRADSQGAEITDPLADAECAEEPLADGECDEEADEPLADGECVEVAE